MKTIPPASFTVELRRRNLWVRGLGQAAVRDLMTIIAEPAPLLTRSWAERSLAPSNLEHTGKLVNAGFVQLDRDAGLFRSTDAGRTWIEKLKTANIIQ